MSTSLKLHHIYTQGMVINRLFTSSTPYCCKSSIPAKKNPFFKKSSREFYITHQMYWEWFQILSTHTSSLKRDSPLRFVPRNLAYSQGYWNGFECASRTNLSDRITSFKREISCFFQMWVLSSNFLCHLCPNRTLRCRYLICVMTS
jgi:hypothetical protein